MFPVTARVPSYVSTAYLKSCVGCVGALLSLLLHLQQKGTGFESWCPRMEPTATPSAPGLVTEAPEEDGRVVAVCEGGGWRMCTLR